MSFFRYPGGKAKLRPRILEELRKVRAGSTQYREPFFGGGSIGIELQKVDPFKSFWINDKDPALYCLWESVFFHSLEFTERIKAFIPKVDEFYQIRDELNNLVTPPTDEGKIVDIGFKKLAIHQISYSGLGTKSGGPLGGKTQNSKYKIDCRWSKEHICKKLEKIRVSFRGTNVKCTNLDFTKVIDDDNQTSLIYLDPPYVDKGAELYQYSFKEQDHRRLADALKNTSHPWVLSYDDAPLVRELYDEDWAVITDVNVNYTISTSRNKSELIIIPRSLAE